MTPSVERLRAFFRYDPETGKLLYRGLGRKKAGVEAGCADHRGVGYVRVYFDGVYHLAHRLIWAIQTGEEPPEQVDHINCDKTDNRWANLRAADGSGNQHNKRRARNNTSGFKGVVWCKRTQRWRATLQVHGRFHDLGYYSTAEAAHAAFVAGAERLHGQFARAA